MSMRLEWLVLAGALLVAPVAAADQSVTPTGAGSGDGGRTPAPSPTPAPVGSMRNPDADKPKPKPPKKRPADDAPPPQKRGRVRSGESARSAPPQDPLARFKRVTDDDPNDSSPTGVETDPTKARKPQYGPAPSGR